MVLSTGETLTCQNAVQEVLTEVIIRMYENYHEVINKKINSNKYCIFRKKRKYEDDTTLPFPIKLYGKTTLRKLAKVRIYF